MKLSVFSVLLSDQPLEQALAFLKAQGVQAVEIGCGGYPGKAHCDPAQLLADEEKLAAFKAAIDGSGLELAALSVHGNAVHPDQAVAKSYHDDFVNAVLLAEYLGKFYQYITRNAEDEKRLYEEVAHARVYAAIQQYRFRENLTYDIPDPPEAIAQMYVPRLILQPILENAFKYAYETGDETGAMRLQIRYVVSADGFDILIENSGKMEEETLQNIRRILQTDSAESETTALVTRARS